MRQKLIVFFMGVIILTGLHQGSVSAIQCLVAGVPQEMTVDGCERVGGTPISDATAADINDAAANQGAGTENGCVPGQSIFGIPTWYKYLDGETVSGKCRPIIDTEAGESISVGKGLLIGLAILEGMMTLGGLVAVVMIFVGAFKYITSEGQSDKAAAAQKTVINAIVGLVIVIVATRVVSFIGNRLG